nr:hypothetical protein [Tanacetum cinerariifolium]
ETVYKELDDSLVRAATTAYSLEAKQDSGGGSRCQEAMGDTIAQTRFKNVSKHSNDSLLARGNTLRSDEDRIKLNELMELYTNLQSRVLELENTKTSQGNEIASLKIRVKKLKKRNRSRTRKLKILYKVGLTARVESLDDEENLGEDASKQGRRIDDIDQDEDITLKIDEVTFAQALAELKTSKPKVKGVVIQELSESTTTTTFFSKQKSQDKGKVIMVEEHVKPKKKDQIRLDEEAALRLQVEFDKEERLTRERAQKEQEANIALIVTCDDVQAKMNVDYQLAERLQAEEHQELSDTKKATLFMRDLRLADEEGVDCLPNFTIFENLELIGTMTPAIICLATNQKFTFSKLIFDSMIRNLDNVSSKFLMYLRFEKGFSGRITDLFPSMLVQNLMGEGSALPTDPQHAPIILQSPSSQPQKTQKPKKPKRKNTQVPQPSGPTKNVTDEVVHKEKGDRLAISNEASSLGITSGGGPRCQEAMGDTIAQTRVLDLEKTKTTQALEIISLKRRVKKLEKKQRSRTHKFKRLYKVGLTARVDSSKDEPSLGKDASKQERKINDIDADEDITLVNDQDDAEMFDVNNLHGEEVFVEKELADKEVRAVVLMVDSITFGHEMVNILVLGEEYDKVFNYLDMLNAPFEGKVFTCANQVKPYGRLLGFIDLMIQKDQDRHHGILEDGLKIDIMEF